jgi:Rrf2 family protein
MHLLAREEAGLRCLLRVALDGASGGPVPIAGIAAEEGLSPVYAAKLMRQLRLAGLVESRRGAAGGYSLARPAKEITVWDAIRALDASYLPESPCDCTPEDRLDCRRTTGCALTSLWRKLGDEIRETLQAVSLASLCEGSLERPERFRLPVVCESAEPIHASAGDVPTRTPIHAPSHERSPRWSA